MRRWGVASLRQVITKSIIVVWSLICVAVFVRSISLPTPASQGVVIDTVFVVIVVWAAVVVPVALIGLLFRKTRS
jgi:hypothetical protein